MSVPRIYNPLSDKDLVPKVLELISKNNYWKDKIYESNNNKPKIIFCSFLPKQIEKLRFFSNDIAIGFLTKNIEEGDDLDLSTKGLKKYFRVVVRSSEGTNAWIQPIFL